MSVPNIKINPLFLLTVLLFSFCGLLYETMFAFSIVFLHELVHCFTAYRLGYNISNIEIFPFGGVAEFSELIEMEPINEIVIALAGPLFNFMVAAVFFIFFKNFYFREFVLNCNLIIGSFNLLPVLPLDGGRILRGILVKLYGFQKGSRMAVKVARFLTLTGIGLGILCIITYQTNLWLLLVSFFVYRAIIREEERVLYSLLSYLTHRRKYIANKKTLPITLRLVKKESLLVNVLGYLVPGRFNIFYVLDNNLEVNKTITELKLIEEFFSRGEKDLHIKDIN